MPVCTGYRLASIDVGYIPRLEEQLLLDTLRQSFVESLLIFGFFFYFAKLFMYLVH